MTRDLRPQLHQSRFIHTLIHVHVFVSAPQLTRPSRRQDNGLELFAVTGNDNKSPEEDTAAEQQKGGRRCGFQHFQLCVIPRLLLSRISLPETSAPSPDCSDGAIPFPCASQPPSPGGWSKAAECGVSLAFLVNFHKTVVWAKEGEEKRELSTKEVSLSGCVRVTATVWQSDPCSRSLSHNTPHHRTRGQSRTVQSVLFEFER